jgi:hypothetical protein
MAEAELVPPLVVLGDGRHQGRRRRDCSLANRHRYRQNEDGMQRSTIQKLLREDFPGTKPLVVNPMAQEKLGAESTSQLERIGMPKGIVCWRSGVRPPGAPAPHPLATTPCPRLVGRA